LIHPDLSSRVYTQQQRQKTSNYNQHDLCLFSKRDDVYVRNFRAGPMWLTGKIEECNGMLSFMIHLS